MQNSSDFKINKGFLDHSKIALSFQWPLGSSQSLMCVCASSRVVVARASKFTIPVVDPCHLKTNCFFNLSIILAHKGLKLLQTSRQKKNNASNTSYQLITVVPSTNDGTSLSISIIIIHHRHQKCISSVSSWVSPPRSLFFPFSFFFWFRRFFSFFGFLGCPVPFSNVGCIELTEASRQTPDSSRLEQTTTFCSLYILISQSISQYQIHSASFVKKIYLYPSYYTSISIPSCHVGTNGKAGVVYTLLSSAASWFLS